MRLIASACAAFIVCVVVGAAGTPGARADTGMIGEIRGSVVDHTAPAHPVAGLPVRLEIVEPASTATRATTTDPQGRFTFSHLPVGDSRVFLVEVEYGRVPYTARAVLTPGAPLRDVPLSVFVATGDRTAVRGTMAFAVVEPVHGALRVSVIQRLSNATDLTVAVTAEDPLVFPFPVLSSAPRAAESIQFVDGWRAPRLTDVAITDAIPVVPGDMQVAYAFGLEPRARMGTLRWQFPYGATDVELLTDPSIRVSGEALHANGIVTEHGRRYARWSGGLVPAGDAVSVGLDGLPVSAGTPWPEIVAGVLALVLACGLTASLRTRRVEARVRAA